MSADTITYRYCTICFAPADATFRCPKHRRVNPDCPWCGMPVDASGEAHEIGRIRGVLWHAACFEDHQVSEMKEAER